MGTRGLYSYRYRGYYFTYYNGYDSYPSVLGRRLVGQIPTDPEEFKEWLESKRKYFEDELQALPSREDDHGYHDKPCDIPPENDLFIEWVYIIDLDRIAFSVDNGAHFRLDNIPRGLDYNEPEWIEYLARDGKGWRCLKPTTPREFVADLHPQLEPPLEGLQLYEELDLGVIKSSEWMTTISACEQSLRSITSKLFIVLLNLYYGRLSDVYQYAPEHPKLKESAEFLLRAAAPGFLSVGTGEPNPFVVMQSTLPDSGSVYYWFRGCLVHLCSRLDSDKHFRAAVGETARRVRQKGLDTCTALLWSVRHVAVVQIHEGRVSHSSAIPVLAAYGVDDAAFDYGIQLIIHYLRPALTYFENDRGKKIPRISETEYVNGLEEAISEPCYCAARPSLPFDIIAEIMSYTDSVTYNAFSRVSRASRVLWACRPRLGPYTVLFVPPSATKTSILDLSYNNRTSGYFIAHNELGTPLRLRLTYQGRHPDDDGDTHRVRATYPLNGKAVYLSLPEGVACCALMTELVSDIRHAIYLSEEKTAGDVCEVLSDDSKDIWF